MGALVVGAGVIRVVIEPIVVLGGTSVMGTNFSTSLI